MFALEEQLSDLQHFHFATSLVLIESRDAFHPCLMSDTVRLCFRFWHCFNAYLHFLDGGIETEDIEQAVG